MKIIKWGTEVEIKHAGIKGVVTGINIRDKNATYEISYFYNGEQRAAWMYEQEFTFVGEKQEIGFK